LDKLSYGDGMVFEVSGKLAAVGAAVNKVGRPNCMHNPPDWDHLVAVTRNNCKALLRTKKGARQKAKFGGTPYKPPVGYLTARERIEGREIRIVITDPDRAPLVRWAFKANATGYYTMQEITDELEERGLRYEPSRKLAARPMTRNAVNDMLRNRYYLGMVSYEGMLPRTA
jgi:hypothetical protein